MSNGLFEVDGIDVAELVAEHLGPRVLPCVLIKPGAKGGRDPANPTRVLPDGEPTKHGCRGFIEDFSSASIDGTLIKAGDRKVTLLTNTIEGGVLPEGGVGRDRVTVEGKTWGVHRIVKRDPAAATYVLQVRDPAKQEP
jgi:hypothetical protein